MKHQNGKLAPSEMEELSGLLENPEFERQFNTTFDNTWNHLPNESLLSMEGETQQRHLHQITSKSRDLGKGVKLWPKIFMVAAVMLIIFSVVLFYHYSEPTGQPILADIPPGKSGATLTLGNGKQIKLSEVPAGTLTKESGVSVVKSIDGQLTYEKSNLSSSADKMNVLSTGQGQTYQVRLPDGSMVYLNASSSLSYSVSLGSTAKRIVGLKGEGYFEIAKDKNRPFIVESGKQTVEVLGTHFNISAYEEEAEIKTTLLEGVVKVGIGSWTTLKPGEQAILKNEKLRVQYVDVDDVVAWKNGYFMFNSEPLGSIMYKLARWYNIKFVFETPELKSKTFFGTIGRFEQLSKVLEVLGRTNAAEFIIKGDTVFVKEK